jgi:hypothetical protein
MGIIDKISGRRRKSSGGGETFDVSRQGYPEEAPAGTAAGGDRRAEDTPQRQSAKPDRKHDVERDDGKATGNPHSAG